MVQYVRSSDRRIAAESEAPRRAGAPSRAHGARSPRPGSIERPGAVGLRLGRPAASPAAGSAGMRPIATPLAASGFSPRAAGLARRAPPAARAWPRWPAAAPRTDHPRRRATSRWSPGSPLSIAMVTGDFDLSGIGTVTHVEGDRVYGFGHPMFGLGACEFPMMTGYIHTVYPRASVSMKMGSPLKVVGVARHRRQHRGRRPDRPQARHAADDASRSRPAATPSPRPTTSRSSASRTCCPTWSCRADQRHRHRGEPARGADREDHGATIQLKGHEPIAIERRR